jgi:hypothetical protein
MLSKFIDKIKGKNIDEKIAFRNRVIEILGKIYPQYEIKKSKNADLLFIEETQFSLINLHTKFLLTSKTNFDLKELVTEHFGLLHSVIDDIDEISSKASWADVKENVFLQLIPAEYIEQFPCVAFPFSKEITIGIVVDDESSYSYVLVDDLLNWEVEKEEIYKIALDNLENATDGIALDLLGDEWQTKGVICNEMDSFDAARILSDSLQKTVAEMFGESYLFGIPNRDFLICWSKDTDEEFQNSIKFQIQKGFHEQPYQLSENIFEMTEKGEIRQISNSVIY